MIKANELRIGNYITFTEENTVCKVKGIDADGLGISVYFLRSKEETWIEVTQFQPITLTPKILEKCGFESYGDNKEYFKHDNLIGLEFLDQSADFKVFDTGSVVLTHLKYLHQLQNLYFALTGEELQIKDL